MILPKAILKALGLSSGTAMELRVEKGSVLARPITAVRAGWAEDAALIGALEPTAEERDGWTVLSRTTVTGSGEAAHSRNAGGLALMIAHNFRFILQELGHPSESMHDGAPNTLPFGSCSMHK
jgi:antitoxin component of MazEF toxin-antitoxin module